MDKNIYYQPEAFGLTILDSIEYSGGSYEFDTRVVWQNKLGQLFTARDSGCSCPTPFEDMSLETLEHLDFDELRKEVLAESSREYAGVSPTDAQAFLWRIHESVRASAGRLSYVS